MSFDFNQFIEQYDGLAKQYELPNFKILNTDFELEKINQESVTILRVVRKTMMDKIVNTISFLEMLLNPVNAPRIYIPYLKVMTVEDRNVLDKLYSTFGKLSLQTLPLEIDYSEKDEAVMIKNIYKTWEENKKSLKLILLKVATPTTGFIKREKSYFG